MPEKISDVPDSVLGFRASGELTSDDYRNVLVPVVEAALQSRDKLRLLYLLGEDVTGFSAGAVRQAVTGIVVDLGEVTFLDAAGLGVLAGAVGRARHLPGGLRLVAVPARVLRLLTLTGLDRHLAAVPAPPGSQPQRERADPLAAATGASSH